MIPTGDPHYNMGVPTEVYVGTVNFGKSTAKKVTAVGHIFATDIGKPAPNDPECAKDHPWPTETRINTLVPYEPPPSEQITLNVPPRNKQGAPESETLAIPSIPIGIVGWKWGLDANTSDQDIADVVQKTKNLFITGCIYYEGLDGSLYYSDVCDIWTSGNDFPSCNDRSRNLIE